MNLIPPDEVLFGRSATMVSVRKRVEKICNTDVPILLCGDVGTGKESLARWIHTHSPFREGQFVKVSCAAIPGTLLESELFGYEKGAFTDAHATKPGRVELANRGTLFLDEISDLDLTLQGKLLHFVQDSYFSRIGGETELFVDTRIICATNRDLTMEIDSGRFRADLYYRISVLPIKVPTLQERREDVPLIAEYFRGLFEKQFAKESKPLSPRVVDCLGSLSWPGNVRELSNFIARYVLIGENSCETPTLARPRPISRAANSGSRPALPLKTIAKEAVIEVERSIIMDALRTNQWNRRKTAEALKISYRALIYKLRNAGLSPQRSPKVI